MTISTLSMTGTLGLIVAVVLCAILLIVNVRREIQSGARPERPAAPAPKAPEAKASEDLVTAQVIAAAAAYWVQSGQDEHTEQ